MRAFSVFTIPDFQFASGDRSIEELIIIISSFRDASLWRQICYDLRWYFSWKPYSVARICEYIAISKMYARDIGNNIVNNYRWHFELNFRFLDDNARPYRVRVQQLELDEINNLSLPLSSPGVNCIDTSWDMLIIFPYVWDTLDQGEVNILTLSMPRSV